MTEVTGLTARRQHEIVVVQRVLFEKHLFAREVKIHSLVEQHRNIGAVGENGTNRLRDFRGGKSAGGDLIKQRLEQMVIRAIDDSHKDAGATEVLAKCQPAETRSEHDHTNKLLFIAGHAPNLNQPPKNATRRIQQNRMTSASAVIGSILAGIWRLCPPSLRSGATSPPRR